MIAKPCPSCIEAQHKIGMRIEAIQPLPEGAMAPLGLDKKPQCYDCASAGTLMRIHKMDWTQARIAVANERQEQYRGPWVPGVPLGLVPKYIMRPSKEGDLEKQHQWLKDVGLWGSDNEI